jgi:hypothetical protein
LILGAALDLLPTLAEAGPCSANIAQFEAAIRQSAGNPYAGLTAPQSVAAQDDRQPTITSMKKAERDLKRRPWHKPSASMLGMTGPAASAHFPSPNGCTSCEG